jgi:hypothetical protein
MPPDTSKALCTLVSLTSLVYINILYGPIWTHMVVCLSQIFLGISIDFPTCSTLAILRPLAASPHEGHGHGMTWKGDRWRPCPEPVPPSNFSMSVGLSRFLPRKPTSRRRLHHISAFQFQLSTFNFLLRKGIALPHRPLALCYKVSYHQSDIRT